MLEGDCGKGSPSLLSSTFTESARDEVALVYENHVDNIELPNDNIELQSSAQLSTAAVQSAAEIRQGLVGFMTAEGAGRDLLVPVERGMEAAGMDVGRGLWEGKPFFTFINVHRVCS
jgi:hypothetical protein